LNKDFVDNKMKKNNLKKIIRERYAFLRIVW